MKRVAIIGGDEFLGCFVSLKFLAEDFIVKIPLSSLRKGKRIGILSGLYVHQNLELCHADLEDDYQRLDFLHDCNILIHCGYPLRLPTRPDGSVLYIPEIRNTASLVRTLTLVPEIEMVIFLTSVAVFVDHISEGFSNGIRQQRAGAKNDSPLKFARFHAGHVVQNILDSFPPNFFYVIVVYPIEVRNDKITDFQVGSSKDFQWFFRSKIANDLLFHEISLQNNFQFITRIDELSERVFEVATLR